MSRDSVRYAFFDFDGTLINQDSFLTLLRVGLKASPGRTILVGAFVPLFFLSFLFSWDKSIPKSCILWALTVGFQPLKRWTRLKQLTADALQNKWFEEGRLSLQTLRKEGVKVVVISASGQSWLRFLLKELGPFDLIVGSRLGFFYGGLIWKSKNCYQKEKITRIQQQIPTPFEWISSWSDHPADIPLLQNGKEAFVVNPKAKHRPTLKQALGARYQEVTWHDAQQTPLVPVP